MNEFVLAVISLVCSLVAIFISLFTAWRVRTASSASPRRGRFDDFDTEIAAASAYLARAFEHERRGQRELAQKYLQQATAHRDRARELLDRERPEELVDRNLKEGEHDE